MISDLWTSLSRPEHRGTERRHGGRVAVDHCYIRWCSDGFSDFPEILDICNETEVASGGGRTRTRLSGTVCRSLTIQPRWREDNRWLVPPWPVDPAKRDRSKNVAVRIGGLALCISLDICTALSSPLSHMRPPPRQRTPLARGRPSAAPGVCLSTETEPSGPK